MIRPASEHAREALDDATYYRIVNAVTSRWSEVPYQRGSLVDRDGLRAEIEAAFASALAVVEQERDQLREAVDELLKMLDGAGMHALVRRYRVELGGSSSDPPEVDAL